MPSWIFFKTDVLIDEHAPADMVPQVSVFSKELGVTITCRPSRNFFEPYGYSDDYCEVAVTFDHGFPEDLLKSLKSENAFLKDNTCSQIFEMVQEKDYKPKKSEDLGIFLNKIEGYLIRKEKTNQDALLRGFAHLRQFANLPPRSYLPQATLFSFRMQDQLETATAGVMANSSFGQESNTAKRLNRR